MRLVKNASCWHKMWSIRFALLSAAMAAVEASVPLWNGILPPHIFAGLSSLSAIASAMSRVVQQQSVHNVRQP